MEDEADDKASAQAAKDDARAKQNLSGTKSSKSDKKTSKQTKDKKNNANAHSDDERESTKTQYVEVNKDMNTELVKCKQKIDKALHTMWDYVNVSSKLNRQQMEKSLNADGGGQYEGLLRQFVVEMNQTQAVAQAAAAKAPEGRERWTVQELENIVYDFITYDERRKSHFQESRFKPQDVEREDLMKIQKLDRKKVEEQPLQ